MIATTLGSRSATPERRFYTGMAVAMLLTVFVGFAPTFFLRSLFPGTPAPPERIFTFHGLLFTAWIVMFVVQTSVVAVGRVDLHRRIGPWGAALAVAMVIVGTWSALIAAARPQGFIGIPVPPHAFLAVPLFDMLVFGVLAGWGVARRREPQSHKRLMLLATVGLTTAAIARWPLVLDYGPVAFFGLTDLFVVALIAWDFRSRGRLHPVTLWGGLALIVSQPLRLAISMTEPWLAFAKWATGLVS